MSNTEVLADKLQKASEARLFTPTYFRECRELMKSAAEKLRQLQHAYETEALANQKRGDRVSHETTGVLQDYDQAAVGMGYMAFEAGKHLDSSPWRDDTHLGRSWIHGWFDASDKKRAQLNTGDGP